MIADDSQNRPLKDSSKLTATIKISLCIGIQNEEKTDSKLGCSLNDTATVIGLLDTCCCGCRCLWRV